jgi:hypothetical protein
VQTAGRAGARLREAYGAAGRRPTDSSEDYRSSIFLVHRVRWKVTRNQYLADSSFFVSTL